MPNKASQIPTTVLSLNMKVLEKELTKRREQKGIKAIEVIPQSVDKAIRLNRPFWFLIQTNNTGIKKIKARDIL